MATNKLQWKRIAKGEKLPCQSFLRKKNGEILKLSTVAGVTVGQDAYYLPVDEVIEEIRNYPIEEPEDERIRKEILDYIIKGSESCYDVQQYGREKFEKWIVWLKSLKDRYTWKPSEEQIYELTKAVDYYTSHGFPNKILNELLKHLKNL